MNKTIKIISGILIILLVGIGAFFGAKQIYRSGLDDGRQAESEAISERLKTLGNAVSEKEAFKNMLNDFFAELPSEADETSIDSYIENLSKLIDSVSIENVKTLLSGYLGEWQDFKDTYLGQDNGEISEKFNQLKVKSQELSSQIKTVFDDSIKSAVDNL